MIPGFSHSISLPMSPRWRAKTAYHARSVSLPCRSHPVIANLQEQVGAVRSWAADGDDSLAWIEDGLSQVDLLLSTVNDFLNLSEAQTVLQCATSSTECLLENFLYLVDSFGSLLSDLVTLTQHQFEVQSALRRHDSALLASSLKSQKRIEKDLSHLAASLHAATKSLSLTLASSDASEDEIVRFFKEAIGATSAASVVLINRVAAILSAAASTAAASSALCAIRPFKKKISNVEKEMLIYLRFEELEECVSVVESGSQRVLRRLMNSRVLLLNIQSNSF
ncbi:hypothetical protein LUZ63_009262 [Rhynchospora breviuscula]|uniref:Uncharacterized protein n=1 Tax=Rhynchospora breviuscula TaxID=2022672 RepID=A0A9Q0HNH0_9POAL|nr:hypothetical protein LUZ63_009262 [Rhynchospora breviuscula]